MSSLVRQGSYYLKYVAIYLVFASTWLWSFWEKFDESVPDWFRDQFSATFIDDFPGLTFSWRLAGVIELLAGLLFVVSIVTLEWLPDRKKPFLLAGLALSAVTFGYLGFGQRLSDQFDGAASLFFYFGATLVTWMVVRRDESEMAGQDADLDTA